jgi:hypothetical protein
MSTRRELRLAISRTISEPFIRFYATGTTTKSAMPHPLWDKDDRWKGSWIYWRDGVNANTERQVVSYSKASGVFVTNPVTASWGNPDLFEIHTLVSASAKNAAINMAIEEAFPSFYDLVEFDVEIPAAVDGVFPVKLVAGSGEDFAEGYHDIFKAWYIPESGHGMVEVLDILPIRSPLVTEILIPGWLSHQTGATLRLQGSKPYTSLVTDTDSTSVPDNYIVYRALQELYVQIASSGDGRNRADALQMASYYSDEALKYKIERGKKQPAKARWRWSGNVRDFRRRRNPFED